MTTEEQIQEYIESQAAVKQNDLLLLHNHIQQLMPECRLWYLDGKNNDGKVVANPNIGYGEYTINYADGSSKVFYQIGLSGNTTGISVYIMGIEDKNYLAKKFGQKIGKATLTGYCVKFKTLKDIDTAVLKQAIKYGIDQTNIKS